MAHTSGGYQSGGSHWKLDDKLEFEENKVAAKNMVVQTQGGEGT